MFSSGDLHFEIVHIELAAILDFVPRFCAASSMLFERFHQRQNVTHTSTRLAIRCGSNDSRPSSFSATPTIHWLTGDITHRQSCTTARITVQLGQHHAGQWQASLNALAVFTAS
jgi:hypothetical protein